jgi:hypothetical protein
MLQGQNILITIRREDPQSDTSSGGRRYTLSTIAQHVPARISAVRPSADLQAQGIQVGKFFNMVVQPSDRDIDERDIITPETGAWANHDFRVTGIQVDSLLPTDPRSHLSIGLERMEDARTVQ